MWGAEALCPTEGRAFNMPVSVELMLILALGKVAFSSSLACLLLDELSVNSHVFATYETKRSGGRVGKSVTSLRGGPPKKSPRAPFQSDDHRCRTIFCSATRIYPSRIDTYLSLCTEVCELSLSLLKDISLHFHIGH